MASQPPCTHSPRTVPVKVGRLEASLGEAGLEQLQDLARGKSLPPGGRFEEEEVTRKAPTSSAVADVRASGQRVGLGGGSAPKGVKGRLLSQGLSAISLGPWRSGNREWCRGRGRGSELGPGPHFLPLAPRNQPP